MKRIVLLGIVLAAWPTDAGAVIGGTVDTGASSVVAISGEESSGASGLVCTGALVARNLVLTARHCIEHGDPACTDTFTGQAKYVRIGITTDSSTYEVARTIVPATNKPCGDDVALLVLDAPVGASDPIADVRLTTAVEDEAYSIVGYGWTCPNGAATCSSKGTRYRRDALAVECIDCRLGTWRGTSDTSCVGDSGGPAFDADKRILGVTSVGGLGCSTAYYTRLDPHAAWLRETVKSEATKAGVAVPAWASDGDGGTTPGTPIGDGGGGAGGTADGGTSGAAPAADDGGCVVAPRSSTSRSSQSRAMSSLFFAALVVLTRAAWRRRSR